MWKPIEIKPGDSSIDGRKVRHGDTGPECKILSVGNMCMFLRQDGSLYEGAYSIKLNWQIWEEPNRWKAKDLESYWNVGPAGGVFENINREMYCDEEIFESGNYFRTKEQAAIYAEECKKLAMKLHESWGE